MWKKIQASILIALAVCLVMFTVSGVISQERIDYASEIEIILRPFVNQLGPPTEIQIGTSVCIKWGRNVLMLNRDRTGHWEIVGLYTESNSKAPSLFAVLLSQGIEELRGQGAFNRPTDIWGNPLPREAIHPERREE